MVSSSLQTIGCQKRALHKICCGAQKQYGRHPQAPAIKTGPVGEVPLTGPVSYYVKIRESQNLSKVILRARIC